MNETLKILQHQAGGSLKESILQMHTNIEHAQLHDPLIATCFDYRRALEMKGRPMTEHEFWIFLAHTALVAKCKAEAQVLELVSCLPSREIIMKDKV